MDTIEITEDKTIRLFRLEELNGSDFKKILEQNEGKISKEKIDLIFLVQGNEIIAGFNKPVGNSAGFENADDISYYYTCYYGGPVSKNYFEIKGVIKYTSPVPIIEIEGKSFGLSDSVRIKNYLRSLKAVKHN